MQIKIKATKIELTDAIKDYVQEKMDMMEKNLGSVVPVACDVEVGLTSDHHNKGEIFRCEVNLRLPGELLRVEREELDLYKAVDNVKNHMVMAIKKYKEKRFDKKKERVEVL